MLLRAWLQLGLMLIGATNSAVWDERRADQHGIWKKMLTSDRDIWFESLSEQELQNHWSQDPTRGISLEIEHILKVFKTKLFVEVKLVGFNGDGDGRLRISEEELLRYLTAAPILTQLKPQIVRSAILSKIELSEDSKPGERVAVGRALDKELDSVEFELSFHVSHPAGLMSRIEKAVELALRDSSVSESEPSPAKTSIPASIVDAILKEDYSAKALSYTIYILNTPRVFVNSSVGDSRVSASMLGGKGASKKLEYMYHGGSTFSESTEIDPRLQCSGLGWIGGKGERYAWIDLSAGPLSWGPSFSGEGNVQSSSLPSVQRVFFPSHSGGVNEVANTHAFLADLADFVLRTSNILLMPPISRFPVEFAPQVQINIMVISDRKLTHQEQLAYSSSPRWEAFNRELKQLATNSQSVRVRWHHTSFADCVKCALSYSQSLRSYSSVKFGPIDSLGQSSQVQRYLDSAALHASEGLLQEGLENIGIDGNFGAGHNVRNFVGLIFSLTTDERILLDRRSQSVSLGDFAVAIETNSEVSQLEYQWDGQALLVDPSDSSRALFASLLTSVWGISPTHSMWDRHRKKTLDNFLWAIPRTPFGPFSQSMDTSFSISDSAARIQLFSALAAAFKGLRHLSRHLKMFDEEFRNLLSVQEHLQLVRRWNVHLNTSLIILDRAKHLMSLNEWEQAHLYAEACKHDNEALNELVDIATAKIIPVRTCGSSSAWFSQYIFKAVAIAFFLMIVWGVANEESALRVKAEDFFRRYLPAAVREKIFKSKVF